MYINIIFILYSIALLISLVCLVFIGLIFVHKSDRANESYIFARRLAVIVMLTDILYFIFYYREVVQGVYELALPFRIMDYALCTALSLCWILVMGTMMNQEKHRKIRGAAIGLSAARFAASVFFTTVFMGEYYNIDNALVCDIWTAGELFFIGATSLITIYCCICVLTENLSRLKKNYVCIGSAVLVVWTAVQGIVDAGLFCGKYGVSAWAVETPDLTGGLLFLLNLATCIFVYKEDFSPLFLNDRTSGEISGRANDNESGGAEPDLESKLDAIAASHKLTVREREVMALIYKGRTNPDIGQELFITINTVKKHTHNIFEKLDVSNRMEVVYLINSWKRD